MTNFNLNASASVDPSTPFCARTFFQGLREAGVGPYATAQAGRRGYVSSLNDPAANERARPWHQWLLQQDPEQAKVDAYVLALLDKHRHTDDDLVVMIQLGICDDEIEPEVLRIPVQSLPAPEMV
ncbi:MULTISPECIES: hypothetical protein [Bradyrhizobium]|jgi:hypothetical protein|uniref:hypothetical protein n=1 Tax=Bradyrhizobium TaxID=374 RepID=UPI0005777D10|nr:hypothetical protein [Bradyrhizobium japonicum]MCP1765012.1 hypothetical protein [Bradyrhizobium japonicum]MCP1787149.1 hypothetical protein [Bradyrhizobium japonicum]MCP1809026.1 hypothetical protein [Bradyrhizobium japonicum]MCP1817956.1 hypothetical protein [Bradyrhizobium japonicum]MCP1870532.1 hypothetical protein [Bradyrhizobium japonicum]